MEIVFHMHFYISISIGFFQVLFKFYANFWGDSSFINGLNRELASQVSTERSLSCHPAFTRAMRQAGMLASRFADCHVHRDKYFCLNVWTKRQPSQLYYHFPTKSNLDDTIHKYHLANMHLLLYLFQMNNNLHPLMNPKLIQNNSRLLII